MRLTPQQKSSLTPLARWLLDYVREHEITLTELSRDAGLSLGALRSLVLYPQRVPKLETCLQLAKVTGEPPDRVIGLAGLHTPGNLDSLDPDRIKLLAGLRRSQRSAVAAHVDGHWSIAVARRTSVR